MLEYRDVKFEYKEWRTWNNQLACGYTCEDQKILEGINTVSFGARSLDEMHTKIDDYIDNKPSRFYAYNYSKITKEEAKKKNHKILKSFVGKFKNNSFLSLIFLKT